VIQTTERKLQINGHGDEDHDDHDHDESGALVEYLTGESKSTRKKSVPFHFFPTRIPHGQISDRTATPKVKSHWPSPEQAAARSDRTRKRIGWHRGILAAQ